MSNVDTARLWCETHLSRNGSLQRDGVTWLCSNPTREDHEPSLSVDIQKRCFKDHGTNESGTLTELASLLGVEGPAWEAEESREGKIPSARARDASDDAVRLWKSGRPATPDHPYLAAKGVAPFDLRIALDGRLMVPGYDAVTGAFRMVQSVSAKPDETGKWPKRDTGPVRGALWLVGNDRGADDSSLVIAEGPSTAAAIKMMFPAMAAVCSFGTSNLPAVYEALRSRFPSREIVIASDSGTEDLVSKFKGALPVIPSASQSNVDWNDCVAGLGSEEARRQFTQKLEKAREKAPLQSAKKSRFTFTTVTAAELSVKKLPAVRWAVPGVIAEGLTVLGGPPKLGKSIFALHIGQAVASGGLALSSIEVVQGSVLYLALEDTARRIQDRLMSSGCAPEKLVFPTDTEGRLLRDAPKIGEGLEEALQEWIDRTPDARMVILDTFQKVRPKKGRGTDAYEEDYRCIAALKALADKNGVAILIVHHTRKGTAGEPEKDFLESLLGSQAIAGSADSVLVMTRARGDNAMTLSLTGRDIEERVLAMTVDFDRMTYKLEGDAAQVAMTGMKKEILAVLNASKTPVSRKDIQELTGMKLTTLKSTLRRMGEARAIRVIQDGEYRGCFEVIPREENLLSRGDSDNGCVSESLNLLHPVNLCIGESLREPDSAIQTDSKACIRDESSNTNGLEHDRFKDSKDAIVDLNRCIGEEERFKTDSPSEELNPVLPSGESTKLPAYDPFAVLGL